MSSVFNLPVIAEILASSSHVDSPLAHALAILFEPTPILFSRLLPEVSIHIVTSSHPPTSYSELIGITLAIISSWDADLQSQFIAGHPRIGESKNLSTLSAREQGATATVRPTPPEVLLRLIHLNACYERRYPGLRYITFVNGRSRAAIAEEMEDRLELRHSLSLDEPKVDSIFEVEPHGAQWMAELERAVEDVGKIANSRLGALGVS